MLWVRSRLVFSAYIISLRHVSISIIDFLLWKSEPVADEYISAVVDFVPVLDLSILTAQLSLLCLSLDCIGE